MTRIASAFLIVAGIILFFSGCTGKSEKKEQILSALLNSQLNQASIINLSSQEKLHTLENKTMEPITAERAGLWYPRAKRIFETTAPVTATITALIAKEEFSKPAIEKLFDQLLDCKRNLLEIDSSIRLNFDSTTFRNLTLYRNKEDFTSFYNDLFGAGKLYSKCVLAMLLNDVKSAEYKIATYCNQKVGNLDGAGFFDSYSCIISQNSTRLGPRESLQIFAGVGVYSKAAQPKIKINNQLSPLNENGYAEFSTLSPKKPGTYSIPVEVRYYDWVLGKEVLLRRDIVYAVDSCH